MGIRLIALDMDGTLLNSKKEKPATFDSWVKAHKEIKTVIASGRQYATLVKDFTGMEDDLLFIAENGGLVFDKGEIIYQDLMRKEDLKRCLAVVLKNEYQHPILCGTKSAYLSSKDMIAKEQADLYYASLCVVDDLFSVIDKEDFVKIAIFIENHQAESHMPLMTGFSDYVKPVLSGVDWIDIANANTNKGVALEAIMDQFSIDKKDAMAFGDYLNDIELLAVVEESYCMENGHQILKDMAKHIAPSNDEDGVMKVLSTL